MEDLPVGSEITLKVVEDKKGECNGKRMGRDWR